jgi:hypothetical protein
MQAERHRVAKEFRSKGAEEAEIIRATTLTKNYISNSALRKFTLKPRFNDLRQTVIGSNHIAAS